MVLVKYKGQNYLLFGRFKIVNGFNEIPDEEFYKLMKQPTFAHRISSGALSVPNGFPLEEPKRADKKPAVKDESKGEHEDEKDAEDHEEEEESTNDRLSIKKTLKAIQKSEDADYLKDLLDTDDRQKVKDAAQKRLDDLESKDKK